jgi:hypothetical protein
LIKSGKYHHELRSLRAAATAMLLLGAGNPPLDRFRVGLEFGLPATATLTEWSLTTPARALAEQLRLPDDVLDALGAAYEQWDGRGWPGVLKGVDVPVAARLDQLAEYVEVAHRVGGSRGGAGARPEAWWQAVRPRARHAHP